MQDDYTAWASHYKILTDPIQCPDCKEKFEPTVPVAIKGYRGLMLADHGCGMSMPIRFVPVDADKLALWETLRPET